ERVPSAVRRRGARRRAATTRRTGSAYASASRTGVSRYAAPQPIPGAASATPSPPQASSPAATQPASRGQPASPAARAPKAIVRKPDSGISEATATTVTATPDGTDGTTSRRTVLRKAKSEQLDSW